MRRLLEEATSGAGGLIVKDYLSGRLTPDNVADWIKWTRTAKGIKWDTEDLGSILYFVNARFKGTSPSPEEQVRFDSVMAQIRPLIGGAVPAGRLGEQEQHATEDAKYVLREYRAALTEIIRASETASDAIHQARLPLLRSRKLDRETLAGAELGFIFEDFENKVNSGGRIAELDDMTKEATALANEIDSILEGEGGGA